MREKSDVYQGLKDPEFLSVTGYDKFKLLRLRVWQKSGGICGLCGLPVELEKSQIDHIQPRSLGGPCHYDNYQIAHDTCNSSKGNFGNNRPKQKRVMVGWRLDDRTTKLIEILAQKNDTTKTQVVNDAVRRYAEKLGVCLP